MLALIVILNVALVATAFMAAEKLRNAIPTVTPAFGFFVGTTYFGTIPFCIITLGGGYRMPPRYMANDLWGVVDLYDRAYFAPLLIIWFSLILIYAALIVAHLRPPAISSFDLQIGRLKRVLKICMALTALEWIITIWYFGGLLSFLTTHWYMREEDLLDRFGEVYAAILRVSQGNQIVFTSAFIIYLAYQVKKDSFDRKLTSLLGLFLVLEMLMTGNRIFIAITLMGFFSACWIYRNRRLIALMLMLSPALMFVFGIWAALRHDLSAIPESIADVRDEDWGNRSRSTLMDASEGIDMLLLFHIVRDFGDTRPLLYGSTYSKIVTFAIPRALYPDKPWPLPLVLQHDYEPGEVTSLNPTVIGELWTNFGPATLILLPFAVLVICQLGNEMVARGERPLFVGLMFVIMLWSARVGFVENLINFVFAYAILKIFKLESGLSSRGSEYRAGELAGESA